MRSMRIEIHKNDMNIRAINQIPQCSQLFTWICLFEPYLHVVRG